MDNLSEMIVNISKAGAYDVVSKQRDELVIENEKIKKLLHELTPGGSEFYNDPEYCAKWIKENRQENHYALAGQVKIWKDRAKYLEDLINEYADKMKQNLQQ